jgi:GMP synthase (glutamine-hydrolysing)
MLDKFLGQVADMENNYVYGTEEVVRDAVSEVREMVGNKEVLAFVSGGVDSSALGALLERALPAEQVHLVYVDNGFMRANESEYVAQTLGKAGINVRVFDGADMFYSGTTVIDGVETLPLYQVAEPEIKRKIIGDTFIKVQDRMAEELGLDLDNFMLAMGTLHTDLIESGSKHAGQGNDTIKSHHNDTEAVRKLRDAGRVIEPWRYLQKDDVRKVAKELGLPDELVNRQPFPGPGLAIRIICDTKPEFNSQFLDTLVQLTDFDTDTIRTSLLPIKTVGVQGDHRTYGHLVGLSGDMNWPELVKKAREIPGQVHGVNRVVYIFGNYPGPATYEVSPTRLTHGTIEELRQVDSIVNHILKDYGLDTSISQVPVVSFPVNFGEEGKRSIGIRTILTPNFKTGDIAIPGIHLPEKALLEIVDQRSVV